MLIDNSCQNRISHCSDWIIILAPEAICLHFLISFSSGRAFRSNTNLSRSPNSSFSFHPNSFYGTIAIGDTLFVCILFGNKYFEIEGSSPFLLWGQFHENQPLKHVFTSFCALFGVKIFLGPWQVHYLSAFPDSANGLLYKMSQSKKMGLRWPLFTIALFLVIVTMGLFISTLKFKMDLAGMEWLHIAIPQPYLIPLLLFFSLISGALNEEFGRRGYALNRLLIRYGFTVSSLVLGFIWASRHLFWFFTPGQAQYDMLQKSLLDAFMFIP